MLTTYGYDIFVTRLHDLMATVGGALRQAGIRYKVVGGMATFIHVDSMDSTKARLTNDIDVAVHRADLAKIKAAVEPIGFTLRHVAGIDMIVSKVQPKATGAVHLLFLNEKVRPHYEEGVPDTEPVETDTGIFIAPVSDLVRMKLTSNRLKDKVHIQDLDKVGLITSEVEGKLSPVLKARLDEIRSLNEEDI
jgi:hypothetical protein